MAIKMRNNKSLDSVCCECGTARKNVLDMFDVCIGGNVFTICDECNEALFYKTLKAECYKNERVKTQNDLRVLRMRGGSSYRARYMARVEEARRNAEGAEEDTIC